MPKVDEVKVLNIDGTPYAVDGMSDAVKRMVTVYNEWNQKEADARDNLALVQSAKSELSRQIIMQVRNEKAEAAKAEEAAQVQTNADAAPVAPALNTTAAPAEAAPAADETSDEASA